MIDKLYVLPPFSYGSILRQAQNHHERDTQIPFTLSLSKGKEDEFN